MKFLKKIFFLSIFFLTTFLIKNELQAVNLEFIKKYFINAAGKELEGIGKNMQGKIPYYKKYEDIESQLEEYLQNNYISTTTNFFKKNIEDFLNIFHIVYPTIQGTDDQTKITNFIEKIRDIVSQLNLNFNIIPEKNLELQNIITSINNIIQNSDSRPIINHKPTLNELQFLENNVYNPLYNEIYNKIKKNPKLSFNFFYFKNLLETQDSRLKNNYTEIKKIFDIIKIIIDNIPTLLLTIDQKIKELETEALKLATDRNIQDKLKIETHKELNELLLNKKKKLRNQVIDRNIRKIKNVFSNLFSNKNDDDSKIQKLEQQNEDAKKKIDALTIDHDAIEQKIKEYKSLKNKLNEIKKLYENLFETITEYKNQYLSNPVENLKYKSIWDQIREIIIKIIKLQKNTLFEKIKSSELPFLPFNIIFIMNIEDNVKTSYPVLYKILLLSWDTNLDSSTQEQLKKKIIDNLCNVNNVKFIMSDQTSHLTLNKTCEEYENPYKFFANLLTMIIILNNLDHNTKDLLITADRIKNPNISDPSTLKKIIALAKKLLYLIKKIYPL